MACSTPCSRPERSDGCGRGRNDEEVCGRREGKVARGHTAFGDVRWVEPVVHDARNTGTTEQHVIRIELK